MLSPQPDLVHGGSTSLANPQGGIRISLFSNQGSTGAVRTADVYLSRRNAKGRLKVQVTQNFVRTKLLGNSEGDSPPATR